MLGNTRVGEWRGGEEGGGGLGPRDRQRKRRSNERAIPTTAWRLAFRGGRAARFNQLCENIPDVCRPWSLGRTWFPTRSLLYFSTVFSFNVTAAFSVLYFVRLLFLLSSFFFFPPFLFPFPLKWNIRPLTVGIHRRNDPSSSDGNNLLIPFAACRSTFLLKCANRFVDMGKGKLRRRELGGESWLASRSWGRDRNCGWMKFSYIRGMSSLSRKSLGTMYYNRERNT